MKIKELLNGLRYLSCNMDLEENLEGITMDSRNVRKGDIFVAISGVNVDGHKFVKQALEKGAVAAVINESKLDEMDGDLLQSLIVVKDTNKMLGILASKIYGYPTQKLNVIGVTGTNGKTTVTHLISKILHKKPYKAGILSTTGYIYEGETEIAINTTPSPIETQRFAKKIVDDGGDYLVMEASSHGIVTNRLTGIDFDIAVFSNITQDHLDFHKTFENYLLAKGLFLTSLGTFGQKNDRCKYVVLNADDPHYHYFDSVTLCNTVTYGINSKCDVRAEDIKINMTGSRFRLKTWMGEIDIKIRLVGNFSIYNSLAAISVALLEGMSLEEIQKAFEDIQGVPGRFETIHNMKKDYTVVIDYAHTPDGLENVLQTAFTLKENRIILVFGCGGNRDRGKRSMMAEIAEKFADYSIVTNDNPRYEEPKKIVEDILVGFKRNNHEIVLDRKEAINRAIKIAEKGDIILIVGKGHENYQIIKDKTIEFNDKAIAESIMKEFD